MSQFWTQLDLESPIVDRRFAYFTKPLSIYYKKSIQYLRLENDGKFISHANAMIVLS